MIEDTNPKPTENHLQTFYRTLDGIAPHQRIDIESDGTVPTTPFLVSIPKGRDVKDLTAQVRLAAEFFKPLRRTGTAKLTDLQSIILWANRFKGDTSVFYANNDMSAPSLTCIADYHAEGPVKVETSGDPTASHCSHRAVYNFPLSDEWKAWMTVSDNPLDKDDMGEFIEKWAKNIMDPTPAILSGKESDKIEPWENRLIATARQIEGRYGQLTQLLAMSRMFQVHEISNLTVKTNRDTGEQEVQFLNEHKAPDGSPLNVPNLIIITIPVFMGGAPYRMAVRFRYRKIGGTVKFILSIYNPERVFEAAFREATAQVEEATGLPLFLGSPES